MSVRDMVVLLPILAGLLFVHGCSREEESDVDGDGAPDYWTRDCGRYRVFKVATSGHGDPDVFSVERNGQHLVREHDENGDGATDQWDYFEGLDGPTASISSYDRDFDGKVDERWLLFWDKDAETELTYIDLDCNCVTDLRVGKQNGKGKADIFFEGEWIPAPTREGNRLERRMLVDGKWREVDFNQVSGKWEELGEASAIED